MTQIKATKARKIEGKFYPLQQSEWIQACKELSSRARDVLYYIRTADPYSNGIELTAAAIARQLNCNRSTISRAFKELDAKGYVDMEILAAKLRVTGKGLLDMSELQQHFESGQSQTLETLEASLCSDDVVKMQQDQGFEDVAFLQPCCNPADDVANLQHAVQKNNTVGENATRYALVQQATAETLAPTGFPLLKTNKDFNKTNQTLSEANRERNLLLWKKFDGGTQSQIKYYAHQVALPKLPTRPSLPDAWITCHCEELFNQMMRDVQFQREWDKLSANSPVAENEQVIDW